MILSSDKPPWPARLPIRCKTGTGRQEELLPDGVTEPGLAGQ